MKADIILKKEMLKGNPGGYYVPGVDGNYDLSFTPTDDDMPQVESTNIKSMLLDAFLETNEYKSIEAAEAARKAAESNRSAAENKRISAENNRITAENERITADAARESAEQGRITAESNRSAAEAAREAAETNREETFTNSMNGWQSEIDGIKAQVDVNVDAAIEAIEEKRISALATLPEDYSQLSNDVSQLKVNKADKKAFDAANRKLNALWKLNEGITYQFEMDNNEAYQKQVISGAKLADIQSVGGKTVVWNQYDKGNWVSYAPANIPSGSVEKNGGEYTYTIIDLNDNTYMNTLTQYISVITGHKYYQSFQIKSNKAFNVSYSGVDSNWIVNSYSQNNVYKYYRYIQTASTTKAIYIGYNKASSNGAVVGDSFSVKDIILIDLTQMFGAGNEPTSTDDSRIAWIEQYAAAHPEYNAGELVSADLESIKYNDAIIADIPASVRALPGYGWSAGSVYNSIERTESGWQYIQRVGSVDLGTLRWEKINTLVDGKYRYKSVISNMKIETKNYVNKKYTNISSTNAATETGSAISNNNYFVYDEAYSTSNLAAFKTAISGVMLYYELAEPIITDITSIIEEPFEVEAGGTITYENAAKLSMPNSIEYTVKLSEVNS